MGLNLLHSAQLSADGFVLIDDVSYSGIGKDASGNGNHFQDQNFAVGNTDEVWSAGGSATSLLQTSIQKKVGK